MSHDRRGFLARLSAAVLGAALADRHVSETPPAKTFVHVPTKPGYWERVRYSEPGPDATQWRFFAADDSDDFEISSGPDGHLSWRGRNAPLRVWVDGVPVVDFLAGYVWGGFGQVTTASPVPGLTPTSTTTFRRGVGVNEYTYLGRVRVEDVLG